MDRIPLIITQGILISSMLWCLYAAIKHSFNSTITNARYRYGVVTALILYLIGEVLFLIYQFDGMSSIVYFFVLWLIFTTFPIAITIDTLILLIFRVLNPRINARILQIFACFTWLFYLTTPAVSGYVSLSAQPSPRLVDIAKTLRFLNAAWYAIYHNLIGGYLIYLVYTHQKKKSAQNVSIALRNSLQLLIIIFVSGFLGLGIYGYGLTLHDHHPLRFLFLNVANAAVGVQMNLLVYLFLYLTQLQFSDKTTIKKVPISGPTQMNSKRTSTR